jgi:hypothetical protein
MGLAHKTLLIIGKNVYIKTDRELHESLPRFGRVVFERSGEFKESLGDHINSHLGQLPVHPSYEEMKVFHQPNIEDREKWLRYSFYSIEALLVLAAITSLYVLDRRASNALARNSSITFAENKITLVNANQVAEPRPWANLDKVRKAAREAQLSQIRTEFVIAGVEVEIIEPDKQHMVLLYPALTEREVEKIATRGLFKRLSEAGLTKVEFRDKLGHRWIRNISQSE